MNKSSRKYAIADLCFCALGRPENFADYSATAYEDENGNIVRERNGDKKIVMDKAAVDAYIEGIDQKWAESLKIMRELGRAAGKRAYEENQRILDGK